MAPDHAEVRRLAEARERGVPWRKWAVLALDLMEWVHREGDTVTP
jgi:hypothetical protein